MHPVIRVFIASSACLALALALAGVAARAQQAPAVAAFGYTPATAGNQQSEISALNAISNNTNGSATAALQNNGNNSVASIDGKTPAVGTQTKAGSRSVTPASDLANIEPAGAPITGAAMPSGGTGLTGWLSAIWSGNVSRNVYSASKTANLAASGLLGTSYLALGASPSPYTSVVSTFYTNSTGATYSIEISDGTGSYVVLQTGTLTAGTPLSSKLPASAMNTTGTQYRAYIQNGSNVANSAFVSVALVTN